MSEPVRRRHPPGVYRRRRLVVLLLALIVVGAVVWLFVAQPWRSAAAERVKPPATATATAIALPTPEASTANPIEPAETTEPAEPIPTPVATETLAPQPLVTPAAAACTRGDVTVDAVTDQATYPPGQNPRLSIRLTNNGTTDCTLNVGTTQQAFTITSGNDTWWRSTDCQTEPSDMTVLVSAGQTVSSAQPVEWDRTRSSVSTCGGERQAAPGGGASYHLEVSIGGIASSATAQFLLL